MELSKKIFLVVASIMVGFFFIEVFLLGPMAIKRTQEGVSVRGVVVRKYYQRGNTIQMKLETGEMYVVPYGFTHNDFSRIHVGDTIRIDSGKLVERKAPQ